MRTNSDKNIYKVPFAAAIKKAYPTLPVGAVGLVSDPIEAESYLKDGKADLILAAREFIRNPNWALSAAYEHGTAIKAANQYERGWDEMLHGRRK